MSERICPFMSRPVHRPGVVTEVIEAGCLRERCAAWRQFRDPLYLDHCLLIGRRR